MSDNERSSPQAPLPRGLSPKELAAWVKEVESAAPAITARNDNSPAEAGNVLHLGDDADELWYVRFERRKGQIPIDLRLRIAAFLCEMLPEPYCDDCISEEIASDLAEVRKETQNMRMQPDFLIGGTLCTRCGDTQPVTTRANAAYVREPE